MIKTEFNKVNQIILPYPKGFNDCSGQLLQFFESLIQSIPDEIEQFLIINNLSYKSEIELLFPNKRITPIVIEGFNEIWLRDILGFNLSNHKVYLPDYKPDYCNYIYTNKYLSEIREHAKEILNQTIKKEIIDFPIVLDGGNFVSNGEICFVTDKILKNNPLGKSEIENLFKNYLGINPIIIPSNQNDKLSHSDGYMSFISKDHICLSEYPKNLDFLKSDLTYLESLKKIISNQNLTFTAIHDRPVDEIVKGSGLIENDKSANCLSSARGVYINFIKLNDTIILPEYTIPNYRKTMDHNIANKRILENLGFKVITLNCDELAKLGGSLHCCSFTN